MPRFYVTSKDLVLLTANHLHAWGKSSKQGLPLVKSLVLGPLAALIRVPASGLPRLLFSFRSTSVNKFTILSDVSCSDMPSSRTRFTIKYCLTSPSLNSRLLVETRASETSPVPTLSSAFALDQRPFLSANWLEREAWDLLGVYFSGHEDLRRVLTDYGFTGHPLRKDFPLTGFYDLFYNDSGGRVCAGIPELGQEFRLFHI